MSFGYIAGAAIVAGGSYLASKSASKGAQKQGDAALEQEAYFREKELEFQREQLDFSRQQYDEHKAKFDPLFDDIRGMMDDVEPDYGAIAGDINMSMDTAQGMEERNMRRYGIKPTDGSMRSAQRDYGIRRGLAHVGARSAARQGAKDKRFGRYADLYNSGQGIGTQNASMVSNAMAGIANSYGRNAANAGVNSRYYAGQAQQAGNAAAAGWGQFAGSIPWGDVWNSAKGWFGGNNNSGGGTGIGA